MKILFRHTIGRPAWRQDCRPAVPAIGLGFLLCAFLGTGWAAPVSDPLEGAEPGAELFKIGPVRTIAITIAPEGLNALRHDPKGNVPCELTEGGKTYSAVAIHLKGAAGSFRGVDDKPGMMLNFDKFTPGQKFYGLKKLMLNNSVQDPTYLNEHLCGYLFRASDVPAPRTSHAMVELNGRKLGLYIMKEDFNKDFLEHYFKKPKGNMYDIKPGRDINQEMRLDFGEGPTDQSDLKAVAAACQMPDVNASWKRLKELVDLDRFLSFIAIETISSHWDGYSRSPNNFKVYVDDKTGRLVFLPNDLDQMFRDPGYQIYRPGQAGIVARSVLRAPEGRRRYEDRVEEIATNIFNLELLTNRVQALATNIQPALAAWNDGAARQFEHQAREVVNRLIQRDNSIRQQVEEARQRQTQFQNNVLKLLRWTPRPIAGATLECAKENDGRTVLLIGAEAAGSPSWRIKLELDPGRYRFEGSGRVAGVEALKTGQGEGAGLRVEGLAPRENKLTGDAGWEKVAYEFEVAPDKKAVELICELCAKKGEARFDLNSMRLVKPD